MSETTAKGKTIEDLRAALFATLDDVRNNTIDTDRARAVNDLAKTLCDTARVELDFLRITNGDESPFLKAPEEPAEPGVTRHRLR